MGLESHIRSVLDEKGIFRDSYYFEFGLKADDEQTANQIAYVLDSTGEFGPTTVFYQRGLDVWGIKFGKYQSCREYIAKQRLPWRLDWER